MIDLDADSSIVRNQAQRVFLESRALYQLAECKTVAAQVLADYPNAAYLTLEDADQPGGTWLTGDVTDADSNILGDLEAFDDDHWGAIDDLPPEPPWRAGADGVMRPDARFDFIEWRGTHTGNARIDPRAATALDLRAGL
ncbi:hypothetical protein ACFQBY_21845 [Promicromonospora citrea]|uniref:Uncharacterized protein n=1 Tax=Promicromonospora citrea TaxID=43677 RepID=A0A8H9L3S0_9MICO|nr:hypothetical protein [Promicromonospora citrea]NNH54585.1 hypothetical protein [Promicromonospora citrea]GGM28964.1 hypothetical protein GCM10010102_25930 [Promicromonospora citrea]